MLLKKSLGAIHALTIGTCILVLVGCGKQADKSKPTQAAPAVAPATTNAIPLLHDQAQGLQAIPLHTDNTTQMPATGVIPQAKQDSKPVAPKAYSRSICDPNNPDELDFEVENHAGRTLYVACFSYQPRRQLERWHWIKSPVYEVAPYQTVTIDVDTIEAKLDRSFVFGYLGIFATKAEADDAVFELLHDKQKLDLDLLTNLKGKKVSLMIERYGMKGDVLDYDFVQKNTQAKEATAHDLVFSVENDTGRTVFVACFVYEKRAKGSWIGATEEKDDMTTWHYEKMNVLRLEPGQIGQIDIGNIATMRDKSYIRGELAVFDETQEQLAYSVTYELLPPNCKVALGPLARVANKKVVLDIENYGIMQDYLNYTVKPASHIDFKAIHLKK